MGENGEIIWTISIPDGEEKTLGSFKDEYRFKLWNDTGYKQLSEYILKERKDGDVDIDKIYVPFNVNALLSSIYTCDLPSKDRILSYVKKSVLYIYY